ncbi:hypothetical protein [Neisseria montereyensis]|uniref:Uncharacterized protein n=1 Tax=Neisseria montereyensis TaxID=2973938 RepID=A0ABT2FCI0_9NEIS|nr:hypothetical protein [Neisseria montereyensis]MCS4533265.1 hypothetical protein [Neisseria montereyensis]
MWNILFSDKTEKLFKEYLITLLFGIAIGAGVWHLIIGAQKDTLEAQLKSEKELVTQKNEEIRNLKQIQNDSISKSLYINSLNNLKDQNQKLEQRNQELEQRNQELEGQSQKNNTQFLNQQSCWQERQKWQNELDRINDELNSGVAQGFAIVGRPLSESERQQRILQLEQFSNLLKQNNCLPPTTQEK